MCRPFKYVDILSEVVKYFFGLLIVEISPISKIAGGNCF